MTDSAVLGLEGKKALVVGGGSGIGRATSLLLARAGADVVVGDLSAENASSVAAEVEKLGVKAGTVGGDVTIEKEAVEAVNAAAEFHGDQLDVLVNIVGFAAWKTIFEIDDEVWQLDISRNLTQHLYVSRAAGRHMIDHGTKGRLALVASVSGIYGAPNHGTYGAAKAGVMDLVRTMSQEWGSYGIRVNAVAPDCIATPRVRAPIREPGGRPGGAGERGRVSRSVVSASRRRSPGRSSISSRICPPSSPARRSSSTAAPMRHSRT